MADKGNELEKLKRQGGDLVAELHARNLLIPAGFLVVLILAAIFVLPNSAAPPPPVNVAPVAGEQGGQITLAKVANISLVSAVPLDERPQTYGESNPFKVGTPTSCRVTKDSKPREFECVIGDTVVTYACLPSDEYQLCIGETGATGASGQSGGTESTGGTLPPDSNGNSKPKQKTTYYTIDVTYDGKTYKGLEAGDQLPSSGTAIVFYAGPNSSAKKAGFVLGDNITVQGAEADPDLGTFEIAKGDEVVLTESDFQVHTLKLKKITKVTK